MSGMDEKRKIEVERLVLREPNGGRIRAVLETQPRGTKAPCVRLVMFAPSGDPAITLEIDEEGEGMVHVGHPDHGPGVVVSEHAVDVWKSGNVVASLPLDADQSSTLT